MDDKFDNNISRMQREKVTKICKCEKWMWMTGNGSSVQQVFQSGRPEQSSGKS